MAETIRSPQNPAVKLAVALKQKKRRDELGLFMVEGVRLCEELLASGWDLELGLYTESAAAQPRAAAAIAAAARRCRMLPVSDAVLAKAAETENPQGVLLIARQAAGGLSRLLETAGGLIVIIDGVQDPGNMGTLLRTADAAGADGVIVLAGAADPFCGKALRASMGSVFHLPLVTSVGTDECIAGLRQRRIRLAATALEGAVCYLEADLTGPLAVAFGNEGNGVSQELLAQAELKICIPIYGQAESLNVAAAAAVILYEAVRRRQA